MSLPPELIDLVRRFVDDRDSLEEHEYAQLVEAVKTSPELALQLRDQLIIDDALSQRLAIDRRHFDAQVQQRIADHLRGEDELNQQADELRTLALARLEGAPAEAGSNASTVIPWGVALTVLLVVGWGIWNWQQAQKNALLAKVEDVSGRVVIHRFPQGNDELAEKGFQLRHGDKLSVADDARVTLAWPDATRVLLSGGTVIDLPATTAGKRIYVDRGVVAASVAKQAAKAPMIFATPHADAIVRGTELSLHVRDSETRLEVAEGNVELVEHQTQDVQSVQTWESATAAVGVKVVKDSIRWPTSQQGLVYLFAGDKRPTLVRNKSLLRPTKLESNNRAAFNSAGEMELSTGWFEDLSGAADVAENIRAAGKMSLEIVFAANSPPDDQRRSIVTFAGREQTACLLTQIGNRLQFQCGDGQPVEIATLPELGKLTHLAVTCDGRQLMAYLDGQVASESAFAGPLPGDATRLIIGSAAAAFRWHGRIAGLAIYDRVLTSEEISRNAAGLQKE